MDVAAAASAATKAVEVLGALSKLQSGLYAMKIDKAAVEEVQKAIETVAYDKWHDTCEVLQYNGIEDFEAIAEKIATTYEFDKKQKAELEILKLTSDGSVKVKEFKYDSKEGGIASYCMVASYRHKDTGTYDIWMVFYKLNFKELVQKIKRKVEYSWLWGLIWRNKELEEEVPVSLTEVKRGQIDQFYRFKALEGFKNEGIISEIPYK